MNLGRTEKVEEAWNRFFYDGKRLFLGEGEGLNFLTKSAKLRGGEDLMFGEILKKRSQLPEQESLTKSGVLTRSRQGGVDRRDGR